MVHITATSFWLTILGIAAAQVYALGWRAMPNSFRSFAPAGTGGRSCRHTLTFLRTGLIEHYYADLPPRCAKGRITFHEKRDYHQCNSQRSTNSINGG